MDINASVSNAADKINETCSTIIKTYDGRRVGIGYGDDARQAACVVLEAMQRVGGVFKDPAPEVVAMELAGSSVNLRARWWTEPSPRRQTKGVLGSQQSHAIALGNPWLLARESTTLSKLLLFRPSNAR